MNSFPMGGVAIPLRKAQTESSPIHNAVIPAHVTLPMLQHHGRSARPIVEVGERVTEGMVVGESDGAGSAHVHASIPGVVRRVEPIELPDGRTTQAVSIDMDGEFAQLGKPASRTEWRSLSTRTIARRIKDAGLVGMGTDDRPVNELLAGHDGCRTLIINGCESQPYLTSDHRLLVERAADVIEGAEIAASVVGAEQVIVAVRGQGNEATHALQAVRREQIGVPVRFVRVADTYPQEDVRQLVRAVTGAEIRSGQDERSVGSCVIGVATAVAILEAIGVSRPLLERVVTVSGSLVRRPGNVKVRLGMSINDLLADCGGLTAAAPKVIVGGPILGYAVSDLNAPITKRTRGVIVLSRRELRLAPERACINCGRCVAACPMGLNPSRLYKLLARENEPVALDEGLDDCTECGACGHVCPSRIPLTPVFRARHRTRRRERTA